MSAKATMSVPFIDLSRYEEGFVEALSEKHRKMTLGTQFVGGPEVQNFELGIKKYTESAHAISCANGTDALQLLLRALDVGPDDKVLVCDLNFWAAFEAVVNVGALPITVDVDPKHLHLGVDVLELAARLHRPKAIILVHLYGWADQEINAIRAFCKRHEIALIEDCAQSIGTRYQSASLIGSAEYATTSFYPAKVLGASGDAGAVFCADADVAQKVRQLANHGRSSHYDYEYVGWNSRLGAFEAAFMNLALEHLPTRIRSRRRVQGIYREELANLPLQVLSPHEDVYENGYIALLRIDGKRRDKVQSRLAEMGVATGVIYPVPMKSTQAASKHLYSSIDNGHSTKICSEILCLPCFAYMRDDEIAYVVEQVKTAIKG
ncbi:MAG TPA: DegT/DnrJ/EryC1/StrS family aminotransferase [Bdellovibrionota bacterium]|jgi:dTDP-4-amino-4,6-dideoxygalactose transaminase|nr:DegT/DnrJ/EryC1/StrS family aminotransferase [Bdellovibrionota bacterium]